MSKQANAKQDFYKEAHEAALAWRQAKTAAEAAVQATMAAEKTFRSWVDPFCLLDVTLMKRILDKWADDPPQPSKKTP